MKDILVKDIIRETHGLLIQGNENVICENFSRDSRNIKKDDIYIAIKGEKFDGNLFLKNALDNGAKVAICQELNITKEELNKYKDKTIIKVEDTIKALHQIAKYKRSLYQIPVVAITGSVGKTSTKDIIANVISQKYKTLKTEANQNNDIGLPFTILKLKDEEVLVVEMGMNHFGEISRLTKIAKPTISVITNIGTSHIGNLGSRENILKAKLEILEGMDKKIIVINNDNDLLNKWCKNEKETEIYTFGIENKSQTMAENIQAYVDSSEFECEIYGKKYKIKIPVGGKHFVLNALCAISIGKIFNIEAEKIKDGIEKFNLTKRRMDIIKSSKGVTIINDSYNASYESMKAAIEYLSSIKNRRKIAILGDMFELGNFSYELHENVGKEIALNKIDLLFCTGELSKKIKDGAIKNGMSPEKIKYCDDKEKIIEEINKITKEGDIILVKASNGMKFYDIVEMIN